MIKYIGSKRRLVPTLTAIVQATGVRTALDLFSGTTRVACAFKRAGATATAVDTARYSKTLADCFVALDATTVDRAELTDALAFLASRPPAPGYFTETFCVASRFFQPKNGARIDAIRNAIASDYAGTWLEPVLLTSLMLAADRVDSTTGVQMAYLKSWAPRASRDLQLTVPELLPGPGTALRADATDVAGTLGHFDVAYLDPPYNQHRYFGNYHIWETLIAWDAPEHYGVACKRIDVRDPTTKSVFNSKRTMPAALARCVGTVDADLLVLSYNDESWLSLADLVEMCAVRGSVRTLTFEQKRYVGSQIGVHNPDGVKVSEPTRLRNVEWLVLAGEPDLVDRAALAAQAPISKQRNSGPHAAAPSPRDGAGAVRRTVEPFC